MSRNYAKRKTEPAYALNRKRWVRSPRGVYWQAKQNARSRGIAWEFTFEQWFKLWTASGKWEQRGNGRGCYVMHRFGDVGPYSVTNCAIVTFGQNARYCLRKRHTKNSTTVTFGESRE